LIVAGALLSTAVNPVLFALIEPLDRRLRDQPLLIRIARKRIGDLATLGEEQRASLVNHAVICGYGRVGRLIGPALERRGFKYAVITQQRDEVDRLRAQGVIAIYGDAAHPEVLELAGVEAARLVVVATSEPNETRLIVERVHELDPAVDIVVRTHSDSEAAHLRALGGKVQAVHGERELAVQMARYSLRRFGLSSAEAEAVAQGLRGRAAIVADERVRPGRLAGAAERLRDRISGRRA
jgi:CPA2 family monovalent cation:H+ antiporter-2